VLRLARGIGAGAVGGFVAITALGLASAGLLGYALLDPRLAPTATAHDALVVFILGYSLFHCALAALATALQVGRLRAGYVGAGMPYEPLVVARLWYYAAAVGWSSYAALVLFPAAWGVA